MKIEQIPVASVAGSFELPSYIFKAHDPFIKLYQHSGQAAIKNYSLYHEVCQQLQPQAILEIGVRAGYSAYAMLSSSPPGIIYRGIDLNQGTDGGVVGYIDYARQMLPKWFPENDIKVVCEDSQKLRNFDMNFTLCHVDGNHSYEGALHDIELCARHADYVLIDDVTHLQGVHDAVEAFLDRNYSLFNLEASFYETWRGHVMIRTTNIKNAQHEQE